MPGRAGVALLALALSACAEHHVVDDVPFRGSCIAVYSDCGPRTGWRLWGESRRTCTDAQLSLSCGETATARSGDTYECRCGASR